MSIDDRELDHRLSALTRHCPPPPGARQQLLDALPDRRAGRPTNRRRWLAGVAAACLLALAPALVWMAIEQAPTESTNTQADTQPLPEPPPAFSDAGLIEAWAANQRAIQALQTAMQETPQDPLLAAFLTEAQLQQSELIALSLRHDLGKS